MGAVVFENQLFDHWLNKNSQDISIKLDTEQATVEDMIILTLKARTDYFHHMDVEFRDEFKKIDKKFDRMYTAMMWGFGILITSIFGLYLKDFLS